MLSQLGTGTVALTVGAPFAQAANLKAIECHDWLDARQDFGARGDGFSDDTPALQRAIDAGAEAQRVLRLPGGVYSITRPLTIPSNTMLIGAAPAMGFGCRLEPKDCAAFIVGGKTASFHCLIENVMIWPKGTAAEFIVSIDNSYSVVFRNLRIHETSHRLKRAAVVLLGDPESGGHGRCNNIIWDNVIVRNDIEQPPTAILAVRGCGSHRFIAPCVENFGTLLEWQGGQIDWVLPYTERAGVFGVNCNTDADDHQVYFNSFGGSIDCANSGIGCAIRSTTKNFNSFGTLWGGTADRAAYIYGLPAAPAVFHGVVPNLSNAGNARFNGVEGWRAGISFPQGRLRAQQRVATRIAARGMYATGIDMPGALVGEHWASVVINADSTAVLTAYVDRPGKVSVTARNPTDAAIDLTGTLFVECGIA